MAEQGQPPVVAGNLMPKSDLPTADQVSRVSQLLNQRLGPPTEDRLREMGVREQRKKPNGEGPVNGESRDLGDEGEWPDHGDFRLPEGEEPPAEASEEGQAPQSEVVNGFNELAEKAGLSTADLYKVEVPLSGERGTITLGELKDLAQENIDYIEREEQLEKRQVNFDTASHNTQREVAELINLLTTQFGSEAMGPALQWATQRARAAQGKYQESILNAFPQWTDEVQYTTAMRDIEQHLKPFGISKTDIRFAKPEFLRYVVGNIKQEKRRAEAKRKVTNGTRHRASAPTPQARAGSPGAQSATQRARESGRFSDQVNAVSRLLESSR